MTEHSPEFMVKFGTGVAGVMRQCDHMVREAYEWARGIQWAQDLGVDPGDADDWRDRCAQAQRWANETELSYLRCLNHLLVMASQSGELKLFWDGPNSLFFRAKSGFHGAMVFHRRYVGGKQPTPTGTFELHT